MAEQGLKTNVDPKEVAYQLKIRKGAYLPVEGPIEIVGIAKSFPAQREIVLRLKGVAPHKTSVATVLEHDVLIFAKTILHHFEPEALDPRSDMHKRIRQIDRRVEKLATKLLKQK